MKKRFEIEKAVKEIIESQNLAVPVDFVMDYWGAKQWRTKQGTQVKSYEVAVHVCNSIYVTRQRRLSQNQVACASLF